MLFGQVRKEKLRYYCSQANIVPDRPSLTSFGLPLPHIFLTSFGLPLAASIMPPRTSTRSSAKETASGAAPATARSSNRRRGQEADDNEQSAHNEQEPDALPGSRDADKGFESFYPPLNLATYLQQLDKWPLARLKKALAEAKYPRRNRPPAEVAAAAVGLVRDREKVIIMLALIGGCREGLIRREL